VNEFFWCTEPPPRRQKVLRSTLVRLRGISECALVGYAGDRERTAPRGPLQLPWKKQKKTKILTARRHLSFPPPFAVDGTGGGAVTAADGNTGEAEEVQAAQLAAAADDVPITSQLAAAADVVTAAPKVAFSAEKVARMLPPLDQGKPPTQATEALINGWVRGGWSREAAQYYALEIKPYRGNAFKSGSRACAFQVCTVKTLTSPPRNNPSLTNSISFSPFRKLT